MDKASTFPSMIDFLAVPPRGVAGVILAGGDSRRMGGIDKGSLEVGGLSILERIRRILTPQVDALALNLRAGTSHPRATDLPLAFDPEGPSGPVAGLLAALDWAKTRGYPWVLTVPTDTPFLPPDLVLRLALGLRRGPVAIAASGGRRHPVVGLWPTHCLTSLRQSLERDWESRSRVVAERSRAVEVEWPDQPIDPFLNVNTPEDRQKAQALSRHSSWLAGAIVLPERTSSAPLLTGFVDWAKVRGLSVGGLLQQGSRADPHGADDATMIDLDTGAVLPIMQKLGDHGACAIDTRAIAAATATLRNAIARRADVVVVNKFGHLEQEGGGLIDEILAVMAEPLPLLLTVATSRLDAWMARCGGQCELLAPDPDAIRHWWDRACLVMKASSTLSADHPPSR